VFAAWKKRRTPEQNSAELYTNASGQCAAMIEELYVHVVVCIKFLIRKTRGFLEKTLLFQSFSATATSPTGWRKPSIGIVLNWFSPTTKIEIYGETEQSQIRLWSRAINDLPIVLQTARLIPWPRTAGNVKPVQCNFN
jgi:hypothetical protein